MRFLFLAFLCSWCAVSSAQMHRFQATQPKMGSPFNLVFYTDDLIAAPALAAAAFLLVDSLNHIFSDYDKTSELNYVNSTAGMDSFILVSAPLYDILKKSIEAANASRGAFDITMGPLSWLWRQSRREHHFPEDTSVQRAKQKTGFQQILIDTLSYKVKLLQKGMQLDLGGIAKGYAAQAVVDFLSAKGITAALLDAGGDIACSGAPPGKEGWTIGINLPEQANELLHKTISLHNGAVATSGDVYQFTEHNGKKYSHIIDPETGYGVTFQRNVTVIAADGATADWLATACSIVSIRRAKGLVRQYNAALLIGVLKKKKFRFYKTKNLSRYLRTAD